jgi:ATP-dependent 26S proteasome regulatory subunit
MAHFKGNSPPSLPQKTWATVKEIRVEKPGQIIRLQTDIRTYIANGFISHNCILFIDEIDAIAGNRGGVQDPRRGPVQGGLAGGMFGGMGGLGVMSRLLVEMDGVTEIPMRDRIQNRMLELLQMPPVDPGVLLIMGATNRPDSLDPAIVRPGRFDRKITVPYPDKGSRRAIITGYLGKVKHDPKINLEQLVSSTAGTTPALLENAITSEAARLAIEDGRDRINQADIREALLIERDGLKQPISEWDE